jgi:hypothetical protein
MRKLLPDVVLFWGGPLHGQLRFVEDHRILVPVYKEMDYMAMFDPLAALPHEVVEYNSQVYWWRWKCTEKEQIVMSKGYFTDVSVLEVESIMQFLGTLWGDNSRCDDCKRRRRLESLG